MSRIGTKSKKIRASHERAFQAELRRIRAEPAPDLEKAKTLPPSKLFKTPEKKGVVDKLSERLHFHRGGERKA